MDIHANVWTGLGHLLVDGCTSMLGYCASILA